MKLISKIFSYHLIAFIFLILSYSCQTTKYVPDNKYLLNKVEIKNVTRDVSKQELMSYVRQRENVRILGFWRFHLGLYNLSGKDTSKWFNRWMRKIGEEPVIYDSELTKRSESQMNMFLQNKGYFRSSIRDTVIYKGTKKIKVVYEIEPSVRYKINQINYRVEDDSIKRIIEQDSVKSLVKRGKPFDGDVHDNERDRITSKLKNLGYYAFSKEYIYYVADTTVGNHLVNDSLIVKKALVSEDNGMNKEENHKKYRYRNVYFIITDDTRSNLDETFEYDTLEYSKCFFLFKKIIEVHPSVIYNSSHIIPGELYRADNVDKTQMLLSGLKIFKYVDIRFKIINDTDEANFGQLDVYIQLISNNKQSFTIEVEGTNSSGNLGAAGNLKYQHRNLLRGAEVLDLSFRTSAESEFVRDTKTKFNTFEIGVDAGLEFPKFLIPYFIEGFRKKYNPKTTFNVAYNYQRRSDYTRTIANFRYGYNWRPTRYVTHYLFASEMNLIRLPYIHPGFWNDIDSTFLRYSYEDHFILNSSYSLVYNNQLKPSQKDFVFGRFNLELAGNLLQGLAPLWQKNKGSGEQEIFGIKFAQYIKSDFEIRYHKPINEVNSMAYRFFAGVGYPYGNLKVLPFEKRYFTGGANGIRAWPVRGLGPGSYVDTISRFYNQTADIKLEMNAEYRFKLFWIMEGALFADAGNIWSIRKESSVTGGLFKWDEFYKQIAVGIGTGLRLDFTYFLIRVDWGIKARDPSRDKGDRWILGKESLKSKNMALNFAIGYPF